MRRVISLIVLSALGVIGVAAQDPACLETCVTSTGAKFTEFGCVDAIQEGCLCVAPNFQYSVRDCGVQNCGASEDQALDHLFDPASGFCKAHPRPDSAVTTTAEPPATTEEALTTTEQPAITTEEPVTTSEEPASTAEPTEEATTTLEDEPSTSGLEATASPTESQETTDALESTSAVSTSEPSSTEEAGAPTTSETSSSDENTDTDESEGGGGGLTSGAAAGIGVGVGVIVIAVIVVGVVVFLRRRRNRPRGQSVDISQPVPPSSGGRPYPSVDHGSFGEKGRGGESIEMQTNRYEDMPPRQTPRIMV